MSKYVRVNVPAATLGSATDVQLIVDTDFQGNGTQWAVLRMGAEADLANILARLNDEEN